MVEFIYIGYVDVVRFLSLRFYVAKLTILNVQRISSVALGTNTYINLCIFYVVNEILFFSIYGYLRVARSV